MRLAPRTARSSKQKAATSAAESSDASAAGASGLQSVRAGGVDDDTPEGLNSSIHHDGSLAARDAAAHQADAMQHEWGYPLCSRACSGLSLAAWLSIGFYLLSTSYFDGNRALTEGLIRLADPNPAVGLGHSAYTLLEGTTSVLSASVISMSTDVIAPLLLDLNRSVVSSLQLSRVNEGLQCIDSLLAPAALPDLTVGLVFLDSVSQSVSSLRSQASSIRSAVDDLDGAQAGVGRSASELSFQLDNVQRNFTAILGALNATDSALASLGTFRGDAVSRLNRVKGNLTSIQTNFPASSTWTNAAGGPSGSPAPGAAGNENMDNLLSGSLQGNAAGTNVLAGKLSALRTSVLTVPDTAFTAQDLSTLDASIVAAQGSSGAIATLNNTFGGLVRAASRLPGSSALLSPVQQLVAVGRSVGGVLTRVEAALWAVDATVKALPSTVPLLAEINRVYPLVDSALACMDHFLAVLDSVNKTLVALPQSQGHALLKYADKKFVNTTAWDALNLVKDIRRQLLDADQKLANPPINISDYVRQVRQANATIQARVNDFNVTQLQQQLAQLDTAAARVDVSGPVSVLDSLNRSLSTSRISPSHAADMRTFSTARALLLANLTGGATDYAILAKGYCSTGGFTACTANGDCSSGVCASIAVRRCFKEVGAGSSGGGAEQGTACTQDADCSAVAGARCLGDSSRAAMLKGSLRGASSELPDLLPAITSVDSALAAATGSDPTSAANTAPLSSARSAIADVNIASYKSQVDAVVANLAGSSGSAFDLTSIRISLNQVNNTLDSVDITAYRRQVVDGHYTLQDYTGPNSTAKRMLTAGRETMSRLQAVFRDSLRVATDRMTMASLAPVRRQQGMAGVVLALADSADYLLQAGVAALSPLNEWFATPSLPNMTSIVQSYTEYAQRAEGTGPWTHTRGQGALHAILAAALPDQVVAGTGTVLADRSGKRWPKDKYCVTSACLRATADALSTDSLASLPQSMGLGALFPESITRAVPFSREHLLLLPWIIPAIALFFGLWGLLAPFICSRCCCCRDPRWQKCPTSCMIGITLVQLPLMLLITALLFPLVIGVKDVCSTGQNVGYRFVVDSGDALCRALPGASGTSAACGASFSQSITLPGAAQPLAIRFNPTFHIPRTASALLGSCPASGSAQDPFSPVFGSLASTVQTVPFQAVSAVLNGKLLSDMGYPLREGSTKQALLQFGNRTGDTLASIVTNVGNSVMSCGNIKGMLDEVRSLLCCTLVGPVAWYIGTWYILGWAMLILGLPAGCCARKRLPTRPWGPAYRKAKGIPEPRGCCCKTASIDDDEDAETLIARQKAAALAIQQQRLALRDPTASPRGVHVGGSPPSVAARVELHMGNVPMAMQYPPVRPRTSFTGAPAVPGGALTSTGSSRALTPGGSRPRSARNMYTADTGYDGSIYSAPGYDPNSSPHGISGMGMPAPSAPRADTARGSTSAGSRPQKRLSSGGAMSGDPVDPPKSPGYRKSPGASLAYPGGAGAEYRGSAMAGSTSAAFAPLGTSSALQSRSGLAASSSRQLASNPFAPLSPMLPGQSYVAGEGAFSYTNPQTPRSSGPRILGQRPSGKSTPQPPAGFKGRHSTDV